MDHLRRYLAAGRARVAAWREQVQPVVARGLAPVVAHVVGRVARAVARWAMPMRRLMARCMRDGGRGVQAAWARTVAWLSAIMVRGHGIFNSRMRPWLGRAASEVATARATLHRAIAPVAQQVCSRLSHIAAWLRASPLQPVMARFDGWRLSRQQSAAGRFRIEVATSLSRYVALAGAILVALLVALPAFASRTLINDLIFMFTMLALAQYWNLLAGYAGLVSVGQQAFVGLGGYLLFALTIHAGIDPLAAIVLAGLIAACLALPTALVVFRLRGAYFAIGTWVMAEVYRLVFAQFGQLGGGTGTSLPASVTNEVAGIEWVKLWFDVRTSTARDIITYWAALGLAAGTILIVYLVLRSRHGLALAAIRDLDVAAESVGVDNFRNRLRVYVVTAGGTGMVGALDLFAEGAHLTRRRLLGPRLDRLRDLHRRDRRHRHHRGSDRGRAGLLSSTDQSRPLWHLVSNPARPICDPGHAVRTQRDLGLSVRQVRA